MSQESILLIDQMEANGESPDAIAELLRIKEEEDKKFDGTSIVSDLMNKIKGPTPTAIQPPLAPPPEPETESEPVYNYNKGKDANGRTIKSWTKDVIDENTGETTSVLVNKKDVPQKHKDSVKEDISKRMSEDISSVDIEEILDVFQPGDDDITAFDELINIEADEFISTKNIEEPSLTKTKDSLPQGVLGPDGNIIEQDSHAAYNIEMKDYQQVQEQNMKSNFSKYYKLAEKILKQSGESYDEDRILQIAKFQYKTELRGKYISEELTKYAEENIEWSDTFRYMSRIIADGDAKLFGVDLSKLPEDQQVFLDKLKNYYKDIGKDVDGKYGPRIVENNNAILLNENFIENNTTTLQEQKAEIEKQQKDWSSKINNSNNAIEELKGVEDVVVTLEDLQVQLDGFSSLADEEGRLDADNYAKYKSIYDNYEALKNKNKDKILAYQNVISNHNKLIEEYNTPYIDENGETFKNKIEYDIKNFNASIQSQNDLITSDNILRTTQMELIQDSEDLGLFVDMVGRNYSEVAQFHVGVRNAIINTFVLGPESAWHAYNPKTILMNSIKELRPMLVEDGYIDKNGKVNAAAQAILALDSVKNAPREKTRKAIKGYIEAQAKTVQKRIEWGDIKEGNLYDWGEYIVGASADFMPQLAALVVAPQSALYILSASAAGSKYDEMVEKNKHGGDYSMADIYFASTVTGLSEYVFEKLVTLPLIEGAGEIVFREGLEQGMRNLLNPRNIGIGIGGAAAESVSEGLTMMGENFGMIVAGDNISIFKDVSESAFNGLIMERIIKMPRVFKQVVYPFLPPDQLSELNSSYNKIQDIEKQLQNPDLTPEARTILEEKLDIILIENNKILSQTIDRIDEMTNEEKRAVMDADIKRVETQELINTIKEEQSIPTDSKQALIEEALNEYYKINKKKNDLLKDIKLRQDLEVAKKTSEKLKEKGIVSEFEIVENPNAFQEAYERETGRTDDVRGKDGFNANGIWYVNQVRARETGAVSVGSHEVLHNIIRQTFNGDSRIVKDKQGNDVEVTITEEGVKLIKDFLSSLSTKERAVIQKRMDSGTERYIRDKDKNIIGEKAFEQYAEEYMTYYSDAIRLNQIKPADGALVKAGRYFANFFRGKGYENLEFKSGRDVKNLLRDYASDVKAGEVRESILAIAGPGGAKIGELKFSETEINDQAVLEDVNTINARQAEMDKIAKKRGVKPIKDQRSMRLEANVIDAIKTPVGKIAETLTKALYDPIALDARGDISRNDYRESLKSELNNMFIQEYNGGQKVEKFIINRGWKRAQSLAKRLGIESTEEYGGKGIMKRGDALDSVYDAGEDVGINFDAAKEKVQSMLDAGQITQRRADDLLAQLNEIENDKAAQEVETGKTRRILSIKDNSALYNEVLEEVRNILGPINFDEIFINKKTEKKFRQALEKAFLKTEFAKKVKKLIGTQKSDKFKKLLKTKQNEIQALVGVKYATRFKGENALVESSGRLSVQESAETQTSLDGSFVMNEKGGNETWALKKMTPQQFQDIFIKGRETQYKSLVNAIINELGLDAVFHPGVLPEGVTKESAKLTEAIKRNPSVRFSETASDNVNEAESMVNHDKMIKDIPIIVTATNNNPWGTLEWLDEVFSNGVSPTSIMELEADGFQEKFASNPSGFKIPILKYFGKKNDIVNLYLKNKTGEEAGQQQYANGILELMDYLPPSFIKALGKTYFGLKGVKKDQQGNILKTYSVVPKDRYKEIDDKFEKRIKEKDQEDLPFDVSAVRIINSGYGLALKIRNIQFSQLTVAEKIEKYKTELMKEVEAANINNPLANQYIHEKLLEILANPNVSIETKAGLIRVQESASSNTKAQRGLTTLTGVQFYSKTQAPYVGVNKKGETVGVASEADAKTRKIKEVKLNDKHPDYKAAVRSANERIGKILTILNSKKGGLKNLRAIENGELFDQYLEKVLEQYVVDHLRMKGEHAKPSSNMLRESTIALLTTAEGLLKNPNNLDLIENFRNEFKSIIRSYTQIFGAEINSFEQDQELGTTSEQDLARMFALNKIKDLNINSFYGATNKNINLNGENLISELINETVRFSETTVETVSKEKLNDAKTISNAIKIARTVKFSETPKGITILDFDDTLATTKSLVGFTAPDGTTGTLNAEEYAATYQDLLGKGYKFDFSEFNKVVKGKLAPLFNKAIKLQKKFGPKNMFVLTARPPKAQKAIFDFLKANGLNIPLKNITGLGNSTAEAKALWVADKVAEGYNDFYFADDALQNVQAVDNMLEQFDVKRKVQQAKVKFSETIDGEFNDILEETTGMQSEKEFSSAKAKLRGKGKGMFDFFIPPSAEDFKGLLYKFLAKGKKGDQQMAWFKKALLDPFARGYRELNEAKQAMWNDYNALRKAMPDIRKKLTKKIEGQKDFRYSDAVRVYLWDKAGYDVPGLSKSDKAMLLEVVNNDQRLKDYANALGLISKRPEGYVEPSREWLVGNIMSDLEGANKVNRADFLAEWIENKNIIFSEKNLNKIEALYGANFREALEDMLYRMEKGTNRITGSNRLVNAFQNWINNSVGAIMFFNARSAVLQTLSTVNFINWGDNNMAKAAMAFANQKQFWKDFTFLFNSDMLKQRRKGLKTDVNTAELTEAVGRSKNPVMAALNYLLQKGFLPTQIADSFAISSGGATFYRNRVNTYLKEGLSQKEAEAKAFQDFQEIAEETQQSSRPDLISQQQASTLGRLILAFQNTPMQYMRLTKKAISDLVNGRGDARTNISRIIYYGAVQNVIFFSLQSALFALAFDDDEDDEKRDKIKEKKIKRLYSGMLDSILRGTGVGGAIVSTIKNMIIKLGEEEGKGWNKDLDNVWVEALQLSPPIGSKIRKLRSAGRSWDYNRDVINKMDTFDLDSPVWDAVGNVVSALTNVPMDRLVNKTKNIREALNDDNANWQRIALVLGWNRWDLNIKSDKIELVKTIVKEEKKQKAKEKREEKKKEEEAIRQLEIDNTIKEEVKEEKEAKEQGKKQKEYKCANVNSKGKRCSIVVAKAGMRCTIHEKVEKNASGKKTQCKKIKGDGKRCGMQTANKSGYCYYHD